MPPAANKDSFSPFSSLFKTHVRTIWIHQLYSQPFLLSRESQACWRRQNIPRWSSIQSNPSICRACWSGARRGRTGRSAGRWRPRGRGSGWWFLLRASRKQFYMRTTGERIISDIWSHLNSGLFARVCDALLSVVQHRGVIVRNVEIISVLLTEVAHEIWGSKQIVKIAEGPIRVHQS